MVDHGYDVQNYVDIDPTFGSMDDFDDLVTEAHQRGLAAISIKYPSNITYERN